MNIKARLQKLEELKAKKSLPTDDCIALMTPEEIDMAIQNLLIATGITLEGVTLEEFEKAVTAGPKAVEALFARGEVLPGE